MKGRKKQCKKEKERQQRVYISEKKE